MSCENCLEGGCDGERECEGGDRGQLQPHKCVLPGTGHCSPARYDDTCMHKINIEMRFLKVNNKM